MFPRKRKHDGGKDKSTLVGIHKRLDRVERRMDLVEKQFDVMKRGS